VVFTLLLFLENSFEDFFKQKCAYYILKTQLLLFCMWKPSPSPSPAPAPAPAAAEKHNYAEVLYDATVEPLYENFREDIDRAFLHEFLRTSRQ
jgi:hypothetical protein